MNNIYKADGSPYQDDLGSIIIEVNDYICDYINRILTDVLERKLMGLPTRKDIVGDLRRGVLFLIMIKKEMLNGEANRVLNPWDYYIKKYDTEGYRDYLVCKGVDSEIVDGIYSIIDFVYIVPEDGGDPLPPKDAGIGDMQIEGSTFPFKIY